MQKAPAISMASGPAVGLILQFLDVAVKIKTSPTWKGWVGDMDPTLLTVWTPISLGFGIALILWGRQWHASRPVFDMMFQEAIAHCLSSGSRHISWGYQNRPTAERLVARDIVEEARKGKIRVSGIPHKATHPRKIHKRKLKKLVPYDEVVPKSPETPDGYNWMLGPKVPAIGEIPPGTVDSGYRGLRVDSRDIYRLWPQNRS